VPLGQALASQAHWLHPAGKQHPSATIAQQMGQQMHCLRACGALRFRRKHTLVVIK